MSEHESSRNATEAPTSGVTEQRLQERVSGGGLTEDQLSFVTLMAQYYGAHSTLMSVGTAITEYMFTETEFHGLLNDSNVQAALQERGVAVRQSDLDKVDNVVALIESDAVGTSPNDKPNTEPVHVSDIPWQEKTLSPIQLIVANTMMDLIDTRSYKKKLQDLGVSSATYQMWLKDPIFSKYMRDTSEAMLKENEHEAYLALIDKVRAGDSKALSMYLEMQGIYVPDRGQNVGTQQIQDFKMMMIKILEIITEEAEPHVSAAIGLRVRALVGITETANALVNTMDGSVVEGSIHQPKIKPARQLSPRLQELMNKGVGND